MSDVGERELLAIIFTDAVDSTARTASDEDYSLRILLADLDYMRNEAAVRGGTVLKNTGDGLLISFKSAVDAVECALSIQRGFADRAENTSFQHKIGVHIGDVIKKDGDIYGSGVNTASRLVAQCPAGGLCISSTVYELVKQKSQIGNLKLATFQLTNIEPPIKAYKITETQQNDQIRTVKKDKINKRNLWVRYKTGLVVATVGLIGVYVVRQIFSFKPKINAQSAEVESRTNPRQKGFDENDAIIGIWRQGNGAKTTFYPDGIVTQVWDGGGAFGEVTKTDEKTYVINFNNNQWKETVQINKEGNILKGRNNVGEDVTISKLTSNLEAENISETSTSLTGNWRNRAEYLQDRFYVVQDGNKVMWYGEDKKENPMWAHIMSGEMSENQIIGRFFDLPKGKSRNSGVIKVNVVNLNEMSVQIKFGFDQKDKPDGSWTMIRIQK